MNGRKIGEILIEAGLVNEAQLKEALDLQHWEGGRVCYHLIKLGYLKADALLDFLRSQFGVAAVNISHYRISPKILSLLPSGIARQHRVIPVNVLDKSLTLAMENPRDVRAIESIEQYTDLKVDPLICPQAVIEEALQQYYPENEGYPFLGAGRKSLEIDEKKDGPSVYDQIKTPTDLTPENWLRRIIFMGIKRRCREVHLEPREGDLLVRYKVASKLVSGESIPLLTGLSIIEALLRFSGQEPITAQGTSREGWIRVKIKGRELKLVFSTHPVIYGDRIILKLADEAHLKLPLTKQGLDEEEEGRIHAALGNMRGLYLISSPVGRQRDWTMYHILDRMKSDKLNIMTVESFLLLPLPGINQTLYNPKITSQRDDIFWGALRQEADIIGLAEMDDYSILHSALTAAAQRLIVGTLPMADTLEVLKWLLDSGYNKLALSHLLIGTLTIRVIPRLCPECSIELKGNFELLEGTREMKPEDMKFFESTGCKACEGTGRNGHLGLFESMILDEDQRELFVTGAPAKVLYEEAQRKGMRTIMEDGLSKASRGEVDIRDVLRVSPSDVGLTV